MRTDSARKEPVPTLRAARSFALAFALLVAASPAVAQWSRVTELPASDVFSVFTKSDTILAGVDTALYISADRGATWKRSARVAPGVTSIQAGVVRNGRIYAATFGQGVFVSDDLGDAWVDFNQGLVGGFANSQLFVVELVVHGDSVYAATSGAGVYVRNVAGTSWSHFGEEFEPNQASNLNGLAAGGTRLLACAGGNGTVFFRDPGDPDWTLSWLDNVGLEPGLAAISALWTGSGWIVGSNVGIFRSALGQEPWTFLDPAVGPLLNVALALRAPDAFAAFSTPFAATIEQSRDNGATWQVLESQRGAFVYKMAVSGTDLYAGRADGLWRRATASVSVPGPQATRLRFALAGSQPARDVVRFRFELPVAGEIALEVFDVSGRRAADRIEGSWSAGPHEIAWDPQRLASGVYTARLTAFGQQEVARLIWVR